MYKLTQKYNSKKDSEIKNSRRAHMYAFLFESETLNISTRGTTSRIIHIPLSYTLSFIFYKLLGGLFV